MSTASIVGGEGYAARVLRDGAVGYWRLGEPSGLVAADLAPVPHPATIAATGVAYGTAGALSDGTTALTLDGVVGGLVATGPGSLGTPTLEAWLNLTAAGRTNGCMFVNFAGSAGSSLRIWPGGQPGCGLEVAGSNYTIVGVGTLTAGLWYHLAQTFDGTTMRLYVNGVLNNSAVHAGVAATAGAVYLGRYSGAGAFFLNGAIDEAAIYPTALTAQQLAAHYGLRTTTGASGLRLGGTATVRRAIAIVGAGGVRLAGSAPLRRHVTHQGAGGLQLGGAAPMHRHRVLISIGGLSFGGAAVTFTDHFHADSSEIDQALIAKLQADGPLMALLPHGVYFDEAPAGSTRFVIVSLADEHDEPMFGGRAFEDTLYLVKAVALSTAGANIKAAALRIDRLLEGGDLTIPGYRVMTMRRQSRVRQTEVDDADSSIRWQHRGGRYQVMVTA